MKKNKNMGNHKAVLITLIFILVASVFVALCLGRLSSNPVDVYNTLLAKVGLADSVSESMDIVVFSIRIPRIIAAMMIGAMLSLSGAVYQGVFQNPLVSPDILGVSSGASVGAAGAILLGLGVGERQFLAFLGGVLAVFLATTIPKLLKNRSNLVLVLSGIIVGGFLSSVLSIMKFVANEQTELASIVFWQMGSLASIDKAEVVAIGPAFIIGSALMAGLSWRINILSLGDMEAKTLGVNPSVIRGLTIIAASLLTASAVSVSGTIGWIGLVIPHLARLMVGYDHVKTIPVTIVTGALFMLIIDTIARAALTVEIPLSILTGLVGAPCYAWLLYRQRASVS